MKLLRVIALGLLCAGVVVPAAINFEIPQADDLFLLGVDRATFGSDSSLLPLNEKVLDPNFTWTDSSGNTRDKLQVLQAFRSAKDHSKQGRSGRGENSNEPVAISAHTLGQVGLIQEQTGTTYILRIWIKRSVGWQALIYQAVATGARPSAESGKGDCENPCKTVLFEPRNEDERDVIHAYQEVERAVAAHDSAAWGAHIAEEFFAVTSNSDRPLDKATRMAGLDNRKVAGIAPFPLVSARMLEFGDTMVMVSRQQPDHGLPLHVTRVWFERNGKWLEAYSYQTTIQAADSTSPG
ncbi:MAG TPA: nuclear transport factor 2 family protein [Candidatus Acidoferrales bacterium]|nr:nuclear transport factor 2 family protein [Candidatus Acidoferrales bacterium]